MSAGRTTNLAIAQPRALNSGRHRECCCALWHYCNTSRTLRATHRLYDCTWRAVKVRIRSDIGGDSNTEAGEFLTLKTTPNNCQRGSEGQQSVSPELMVPQFGDRSRGAISAHEGVSRSARNGQDLLPGQRWFAVQCQANREHHAAIQLRNQAFQVFLPLREKTWRHARRIEVRRVPFFPGYLFVALDLDRDPWRSVNGTYGVQRLVMAGGEARPMPLPRGVIEAWSSETDERGCLRHEELLRVGQPVRILAGPFGDRLGELIELDDAGRVRVLIELLGGQIPVALRRGEVMAAR